MNARKRRDHHDDDADQPNLKTPGPENDQTSQNQYTIPDDSSLPDTGEKFQIKVKLRSTSKAARNDPTSLSTPEGLLDALMANLAGSNTDSHETSNEVTNEYTQAVTMEAAQENFPTTPNEQEKNDDYDSQEGEECSDNESSLDVGGDDDRDSEYDEDDEDDHCSENDENHEFKWLEPIDVEVTSTSTLDKYGRPERVARCNAMLIGRDQIRDVFYEEMEQPSRETSMLAFDLFDRYGRLRPEFRTHPIMKGTGIWGEELSHGDILLIENIFVNQACRRQALGRKTVEALLTTTSQKTTSFSTFVWPTMLRVADIELEWDEMEDEAARVEMEDREQFRATAFYKSLGFRRVGSTIWFAMTSDLEHPSHKLGSAEDFSPLKPATTTLHPL